MACYQDATVKMKRKIPREEKRRIRTLPKRTADILTRDLKLMWSKLKMPSYKVGDRVEVDGKGVYEMDKAGVFRPVNPVIQWLGRSENQREKARTIDASLTAFFKPRRKPR